jgi:hypothetical protein
MQDITDLCEHYRETSRHLWNGGFLPLCNAETKWDLHDNYASLTTELFEVLVLRRIGCGETEISNEQDAEPNPLDFLYVVPSGLRFTAFINRTTPACGYWDDPIDVLLPTEAEMRLIGYFDFDPFGRRDLEYYRVRIVASAKYPQIEGRDALVRVNETRVFNADAPEP